MTKARVDTDYLRSIGHVLAVEGRTSDSMMVLAFADEIDALREGSALDQLAALAEANELRVSWWRGSPGDGPNTRAISVSKDGGSDKGSVYIDGAFGHTFAEAAAALLARLGATGEPEGES